MSRFATHCFQFGLRDAANFVSANAVGDRSNTASDLDIGLGDWSSSSAEEMRVREALQEVAMATFGGAVANKVPAGEGWDHCHKARMSGQPSIMFVAEPPASSRRAWASSHAGKAGGGDPKVPAHGQPPKAAISAAADCRLMPSLFGRGAS